MEEILVSINCTTYNHEKYIADALESFLMQKTNFKYEILIHDDASTDRTAEIIRDYERKYPEIIKPIYQNENQYSKGVKVGTLNRDRAIGKYIAVCEGDDYWTSSYKLQKQVDFMESNKEFSLCFHSVNIQNELDNKICEYPRLYEVDKIIDDDKLFPHCAKKTPTCSFLYRKELFISLPYFFDKALVGDYPMALILAYRGKVFYFNEAMGVYRRNVENSSTVVYKNTDLRVIAEKRRKEFLISFDEYTDYKYNQEISDIVNFINISLLIYDYQGKSKILLLKDNDFRSYRRQLSGIELIKLYARIIFPNMYSKLIRLKNILNNNKL